MTTAAILLAGGAGARVRHSENKVYLPVGDRPLLAWPLETFQESPLIDEIVLVIRASDADRAQALLTGNPCRKLRQVVEGGATRHASEQAGLDVLANDIASGRIDLVLIHDAARPFVTHRLIQRVVEAATEVGGAVPGLPVNGEVLLRVGDDGQPSPLATDDLRRVQTPQAFRARELLSAYRAAAAAGFAGVDTAESVDRFSDLEVQVVEGDPRNVKVTFVEDLFVAEELLASGWTRNA